MSAAKDNPEQGFHIDSWAVRPVAGEVVNDDGTVRHLEPKVMDVLVELARAYPDVLERDEAIRVVWRGRPMADDGLARCIAALRKTLGDSRSEPRFIQTVPKRGYRLLTAVSFTSPSATATQPGHVDAAESVEGWSGPLQFDNLKILRLLGRGSMGQVHLAQETNLERLVAVKTLKGVIAGDERAERRFRREASAAARIDHPFVTSIYRLGELPGGTPYIVMQYVRGRTLTGLMASSGEVSSDTAVAIIGQLAEALVVAHRERIVHRDVKPGNVLIEEDTGLAILSDFGLAGIQETGARVATRLTLHGEVLGDARYISPEQARGDPPTPASDVYSLAVMAYELLTGTHPFPARSDAPTTLNGDPPESIPDDVHAAHPELARVVLQALSDDPEQRPTATQFLAGVRGEPPSADTANREDDTTQGVRQLLPAVSLLAVAVVIAMIVFFVSRS